LSGLEDPHSLNYEKYQIDLETFDDSQFYRRLLKEIVDIGKSSLKTDKIHNKIDKISERKRKEKIEILKSRKRMKYTIRPDMQSFMAPRFTHDPEFQTDQLFRSLFQ